MRVALAQALYVLPTMIFCNNLNNMLPTLTFCNDLNMYAEPDILMLDEPNNFLDICGMQQAV
jgi:ABC-type protease/lipase transport system fused ATPase/permease subunit